MKNTDNTKETLTSVNNKTEIKGAVEDNGVMDGGNVKNEAETKDKAITGKHEVKTIKARVQPKNEIVDETPSDNFNPAWYVIVRINKQGEHIGHRVQVHPNTYEKTFKNHKEYALIREPKKK